MRQVLDDGGWFDLDRAERYEEDTYHDGHHSISRATGTQWEHETLHRTAGGQYVLRAWSQWQGSHDWWIRVSRQQAAEWLVRNRYETLPDDLAEVVAATEAVKRGDIMTMKPGPMDPEWLAEAIGRTAQALTAHSSVPETEIRTLLVSLCHIAMIQGAAIAKRASSGTLGEAGDPA